MTNDNDLLLMLSESLQNNGTYKVYIDSNGYKTLTPQTRNYTATYEEPYICNNEYSVGLLYDKNPKKVVFPNCSEATGAIDSKYSSEYSGAFEFTFNCCTSITSVSFPSLTTASGGLGGSSANGAFERAFRNCASLTSASFPSLTTVSGGSGGDFSTGTFLFAFTYCTSLTSVSFPSLTTASSGLGGKYVYGAFQGVFANCTSLTSVSFPSLTTAIGGSGSRSTYGVFERAFSDCTSLTSVSFPSLTSVSSNAFNVAFNHCSSSLKVHFKKSMKGKPGLDYKTMGLINADQVVFDLP